MLKRREQLVQVFYGECGKLTTKFEHRVKIQDKLRFVSGVFGNKNSLSIN